MKKQNDKKQENVVLDDPVTPIATELLKDYKETAENYKKIAKAYKKTKNILWVISISLLIINIAMGAYLVYVMDSINEDVGLIRSEVKECQ